MLITNEINGILSDPNKCLTTLTNATQAASPAAPVLDPIPANETYPSGIAGIPSTVRKYTLAGGPYGNGGVIIAKYTLDLAATPAKLIIDFQKKAILGTGTISKTINLYVEQTGLGVITLCRSLSTASVDIWSHGTGTDINYAGNVGIGTATPAAKLDVNGEIRPGSTGITTGGACTNEGSFAYDLSAHAPVYCNNDTPTKHWAVMGGGGLGVGQAWQNLTASRASGTTYTNITGKPIAVMITATTTTSNSFSYGQVTLTIGSVTHVNTSTGAGSDVPGTIFGIVPNGTTYSAGISGSSWSWSELR
jgi:hypothetical protein